MRRRKKDSRFKNSAVADRGHYFYDHGHQCYSDRFWKDPFRL